MKLPAIVLAGAPASSEAAARFGINSMAEIPVAGKPMVQSVVDALAASSHVGSICVVGDVECPGADQIVAPAGNLLDNLIVGMKACGCGMEGRALISTSDIPLVTSEAIDDFIERCARVGADFCYPIVPKEAVDKRFPGMHRTCVRLAEGTFTGGNLVVVGSKFVMENSETIRQIFEARKKVLRLAGLIGFGILARVVLAQVAWPGALNLPLLEKTVSRIMGGMVKAVPTPHPEIGADVDDLEQLDILERLMTARVEQ